MNKAEPTKDENENCGKSGYQAEVVRDTPAGAKWAVWMPLRNGQGDFSFTEHKTLRAAKQQVESAEDFGGWL